MASVQREIEISVPAANAWNALRDVGALHTRLVPGFVTATTLEPGVRVVTFGNGMVARERIVALDDDAQRVVWSVEGAPFTHHNASVQVFADGRGGSRLVWIADLLPDEIAPHIRAMIEHAASVMKPTLERRETFHASPGAGSHPRETRS
jgi:carbon monoxide dehydrogenase subunit G